MAQSLGEKETIRNSQQMNEHMHHPLAQQFNRACGTESWGVKAQSKGSKLALLSSSQNELWILATGTDYDIFPIYFNQFYEKHRSDFILFHIIVFYILTYFILLSAWNVAQERDPEAQPHQRCRHCWGERDGGHVVGEHIGLSLWGFFRIRSSSLSRAFQYNMFHFTPNRYLENSHTVNLAQP